MRATSKWCAMLYGAVIIDVEEWNMHVGLLVEVMAKHRIRTIHVLHCSFI